MEAAGIPTVIHGNGDESGGDIAGVGLIDAGVLSN